MAINLLGVPDARVDYGNVAAVAGCTALSVMFTVTPGATPATGKLLISKFGTTDATAAFLFDIIDNDEIRFLFHSGSGAVTYSGIKTTNANLVSGTRYRIACLWSGTENFTIWINGAAPSTTLTNVGGATALTNTATALQVGRNTARSADGLDGDYSEVAIWTVAVPTWVGIAYGKGMSPNFYRTSGMLYTPLANTTALTDSWNGNNGTNSSGTDAPHPWMAYPVSA